MSGRLGDEELAVTLADVARGDLEAFGELFDAVAPTVLGHAQLLLDSDDRAEELTHEVMVEVWRRAPRYRPAAGGVLPWILRMVLLGALRRVGAGRSGAANRSS